MIAWSAGWCLLSFYSINHSCRERCGRNIDRLNETRQEYIRKFRIGRARRIVIMQSSRNGIYSPCITTAASSVSATDAAEPFKHASSAYMPRAVLYAPTDGIIDSGNNAQSLCYIFVGEHLHQNPSLSYFYAWTMQYHIIRGNVTLMVSHGTWNLFPSPPLQFLHPIASRFPIHSRIGDCLGVF